MEVSESVYRAFVEETSDVQDQEERRFLAISVIQRFMRALENDTRVNLLIEDMAVAPQAQKRPRRIHIVPAKNRQQSSVPNESKVIPASSDSHG